LGHYEMRALRHPRTEIGLIARAWAVSAIVIVSLIFLFKIGGTISRGAFGGFLLFGFVGLAAGRKLTKIAVNSALEHGVLGSQRVVLVGDRSEIEAIRADHLLGFFGATDAPKYMLGRGLEQDDFNADEA